MAANWSDLPTDLLERIADLLDADVDLLRFRSACSSWRNSAVRDASRRLTSPIRVLPNFKFRASTSDVCHLYSCTINLVAGKLVKFADGKRLLHPLQTCYDGRRENLPRTLDLREFSSVNEFHKLHILRGPPNRPQRYMNAAMVWSDSSTDEFVVLAIYRNGRLMKFESSNWKWTAIENRHGRQFRNVIAHKEELLSVDSWGEVVMFGRHGEEPVTVAMALAEAAIADPEFACPEKYLVHSKDDELLLVAVDFPVRDSEYIREHGDYRAFIVYKLNEEGKTWVEVKSLGDNVLFVGYDDAFIVPSCDLDGCSTVKNCIIFRDRNFWTEKFGVSVFDMESGEYMPLENCPEQYLELFWSPPPA